ncbi:MAG: hypothetical protein R2941_13540 [Desulfobacterales bacterium]
MKITELTKELVVPNDLSKISKKHYNVYANPHGGQRTSTHRMVLFYAVECALKSCMLKRYPSSTIVSKIESLLHKDHKITKILSTMKLPNWQNYSSPPDMIISGDSGNKRSLNDAHACWRYGLAIESNSERQITEWLETVYRFLEKGNHI